MQKNTKHLNIIQLEGQNNRVINGTTCFEVQARANIDCKRKRCPYWIEYSEGHNCVHIATQSGSHTLQRIGQIYGLTRMRICQIEKNILEKIRNYS